MFRIIVAMIALTGTDLHLKRSTKSHLFRKRKNSNDSSEKESSNARIAKKEALDAEKRAKHSDKYMEKRNNAYKNIRGRKKRAAEHGRMATSITPKFVLKDEYSRGYKLTEGETRHFQDFVEKRLKEDDFQVTSTAVFSLVTLEISWA